MRIVHYRVIGGSTTIQNAVVTQVIGIVAQEVEDVQMGGGTSQVVGGFLESVTGGPGGAGGGQATRGVSVEVRDEETAVDLLTVMKYGKSIPQITEAVRRNVINRVENLVASRLQRSTSR